MQVVFSLPESEFDSYKRYAALQQSIPETVLIRCEASRPIQLTVRAEQR
jgi:hypothetical protein